MLDKLLKDVVIIIVGKHAEPIAELLHTKKHVNEFNIAKKLEITINQTRNILYKLSDFGLVSSIRKKDKKKGWYTYFWKIEIGKSLGFLKSRLSQRREVFATQINNRTTKQFYICELCNIEFSEEHAMMNDFTCNECGGVFTLKDNDKLLKGLKRNLDRIEQEIAEIDVELDKEAVIQGKAKQRMLNREAKEKEIKKKEAAEKRRIAREAKRKALGLPPVKKKVPKKKTAKKKVAKKKTVKKKVAKKKVAKKKTVKKKA
ncbi:hypothetical protein KAR91_79385 [Candidatus Pacearchaeota archaeon]|nr:hypothetical protein [Candidatus Pacearchaeota archaeon]